MRIGSERIGAFREDFRTHAPGIGLLAAVAIWVMRRFLSPGGIPAGTDMLGFISRSAQNASLGGTFDAWGPDSFGWRRIFSFDNMLGALTLVTHSPMMTIKTLDLLTLLVAGLSAYALAWFWYRRLVTAAVAGLLYMVSQTVLSRWGSGQLNVEIITSLAPVMLLTWSSCLEHFTLSRSIKFALAIGIGLLIRADLVLYVFPFLILYALVVLSSRETFRAGLLSMVRTLIVAVPAVLLLNAAWLLPSATGYRALYETLTQIFSISQLTSRSLTFFQSFLGFGREIGYFAYTGMQTWDSYPWLPQLAYYAIAAVTPLLAYSALWWHRDRRTVFLAIAAILATLAAPGTRPPVGQLYLWMARNIPVFGNLRDPNRWLLLQAIAYALLTSLTIERVVKAVQIRLSTWWLTDAGAAIARGVLFVGIVGLTIVPVLPTLIVGLRTWRLTRPQEALLAKVRDLAGPGRVLSVPFYQNQRFLVQGSYRGWEHDLGFESALFTGRPAVAMGGWNQRSASFLAYEATLLSRRNPAFIGMLASAGVSRAVSFNYPLAAPELLSRTVGPYSQQRDMSRLPGLRFLASNPAGVAYALDHPAAPLSFRRNIAVVLGGTQGIAALADHAGVNLSDWAVFTADDVIESQGYPALLALMQKADIILLADERPVDIAVAGAKPLAKIVGITSNPQINRLVTNIPTDQSAETGSLDDLTVPVPQPQSRYSSSTFSVGSRQRVQIWARVLSTPNAASIVISLDRRRVGSITPVSLGYGFEWVRVATMDVNAGLHRVGLSAVRSNFGDNYEVQEARVVSPDDLQSAETQLNGALAAHAGRIAYAFGLANIAKWSGSSLMARLAPASRTTFSLHTWVIPSGSDTAVTATTGPHGESAPEFVARAGRSLYTVAEIYYKQPRNWAASPYVYLDVKGNGSGEIYNVVFSFGQGSGREAFYSFADDFKGWKAIAFSTANPGRGSTSTEWSRVTSVRVALPSKLESGTLALGIPRPSHRIKTLRVPLPFVSNIKNLQSRTLTSSCPGGAGGRKWLLANRSLVISASALKTDCEIYVDSRNGYRQVPAEPVRLQHLGTEKWSYSVLARGPGVLVWTQAYDPLWHLSGRGVAGKPLPVESLLDGYIVSPGYHSGTIVFEGEPRAIIGIWITIATVLLMLVAVIIGRCRPGDVFQSESYTNNENDRLSPMRASLMVHESSAESMRGHSRHRRSSAAGRRLPPGGADR